MIEETTKVEEKVYEKNRECGCKIFTKFLVLTASVFTGTLLALLVAKALFTPCHCPYYNMKPFHQVPPAFERQMPMHKMGHHYKGEQGFRKMHGEKFDKNFDMQRPEKKD